MSVSTFSDTPRVLSPSRSDTLLGVIPPGRRGGERGGISSRASWEMGSGATSSWGAMWAPVSCDEYVISLQPESVIFRSLPLPRLPFKSWFQCKGSREEIRLLRKISASNRVAGGESCRRRKKSRLGSSREKEWG